jgi:hypothetical protein
MPVGGTRGLDRGTIGEAPLAQRVVTRWDPVRGLGRDKKRLLFGSLVPIQAPIRPDPAPKRITESRPARDSVGDKFGNRTGLVLAPRVESTAWRYALFRLR